MLLRDFLAVLIAAVVLMAAPVAAVHDRKADREPEDGDGGARPGVKKPIAPAANDQEAAVVTDVEVFGVTSLAEAVGGWPARSRWTRCRRGWTTSRPSSAITA